MMRFRWMLAVLTVALWAGSVQGASSLSALGFGLLRESAGARSAGMGFVSLAVPDSLGLNLLAPALWDGPATARFGFQGAVVSTRTSDEVYGSDDSDEAGLRGVAMALPIGRGRFLGLAVTPYTRMDYEWEVWRSTEWSRVLERSEGSGGVAQGLLALATPVGRGIRLGLSSRAIFGKVDRSWRAEFPGVAANPAEEFISDRFKGIGWGLSWSWVGAAGLSVGGCVTGPVRMEIQQEETIYSGWSEQVDTTRELDEDYDLPWDVAIGVSRRFGPHLTAVELAWHGWDAVSHPESMADGFTDAFRLSAGWEWSPEYRQFDPFWRALVFRGGGYLQEHYVLSSSGHQSRRVAVTGGISIPYFAGKSRLDIALEMGWSGSRSQDGVAERSLTLAVGVNHSEKWFVGRRR